MKLLVAQILVLCLNCGAQADNVIFVKLYVDEEEATADHVWKARISKRVAEASKIISRYADVKFAVSGYGTWRSDNRIQDLPRSLREFEQEVTASQARIAIGFSSQYKFQRGRQNLGGTRGPLRSHILIRENAESVLEPERLEVLVHELGHFLGAAHSAAPTSVMRPVVGDGQALAASFQIGFDPHNAQIVRAIGREMRDRHVKRYEDLSQRTLLQLREPYSKIAKSLPNDPAAWKYLRAINIVLQMRPESEQGQTVMPEPTLFQPWPGPSIGTKSESKR